jgi:hypothetical protein
MNAIAKYVQQEFRKAPVWQRVLLLVLLGFLLYYVLIIPSFRVTRVFLRELDEQRDVLFRQVQQAQYIIEDEPAITRNYQIAREQAAQKIYQRAGVQQLLTRQIKSLSPRAVIEFPESKQEDVDGLAWITLQAKAKLSSQELRQLFDSLLLVPTLRVQYVDYKDKQLIIEATVLTNTGIRVTRGIRAEQSLSKSTAPSQPIFKLNGFFTKAGESKALIDGRLFAVGDIYQGYTIIEVNPKQRNVILKKGGQTLQLTIPRRAG